MQLGTFWDRTKPLPGALFLQAHDPQVKGLVAAWMFNEGGGSVIRDATQRYDASLTLDTILWGGGARGPGGLTGVATTSTTPGVTLPSHMPALTRYAIEFYVTRIPIGNSYSCICTQGGARGLFLTSDVAGSLINFFETTDHFGTRAIPFGVPAHIMVTTRGSGTMDYYLNGVLDSTQSFTIPTFTPNSLMNDSASQTLAGVLEWVRVWDCTQRPEFTAADAWALYSDPFRMFRPQPELLALMMANALSKDSFL